MMTVTLIFNIISQKSCFRDLSSSLNELDTCLTLAILDTSIACHTRMLLLFVINILAF